MWHKTRCNKMCKNVVFCLKHFRTFPRTSAGARNEKCSTMFSNKSVFEKCSTMFSNKSVFAMCKNVQKCTWNAHNKNVQKCVFLKNVFLCEKMFFYVHFYGPGWGGLKRRNVLKCTQMYIVAHCCTYFFRYAPLVAGHNSLLIAGTHVHTHIQQHGGVVYSLSRQKTW